MPAEEPYPPIATTYPSRNPTTGDPEDHTVETPYEAHSPPWTEDDWWNAHKAHVRAEMLGSWPLRKPGS